MVTQSAFHPRRGLVADPGQSARDSTHSSTSKSTQGPLACLAMPQEPLPPLGWQGSGKGSRLTDLNRWPSLYKDLSCESECGASDFSCVSASKINPFINLLVIPPSRLDAFDGFWHVCSLQGLCYPCWLGLFAVVRFLWTDEDAQYPDMVL